MRKNKISALLVMLLVLIAGIQATQASTQQGLNAGNTATPAEVSRAAGDVAQFEGVVEALSDDNITVDGQSYAIDGETQIIGTPEVGSDVVGMAIEQENGSYLAVFISTTDDPPPPSQNEFPFWGEVEAISDASLTVDGQAYDIVAETEIIGDPVVGDIVYGWAREEDNGDYTALSIEVDDNPQQPPDDVVFFDGAVEALSDDSITIDGQAYAINDETQIFGTPEVGGNVFGIAQEEDDGSYTAIFIDAMDDPNPPPQNEFPYMGEVEALSDDSITVDGQAYAITDETQVVGNPAVGDIVHGWAREEDNGDYTALSIEVADNPPPFPGDTVFFDGEVEALSDDSITVAGQAYAITDGTQILGTPEVGGNVFGMAEEEANGAYTAIFIDAMGNPPPPSQNEFPFWGEVAMISDSSVTVDGQAYAITDETQVSGDPVAGDMVHGWAREEDNGDYTALSIEVADNPPPPPDDIVFFDGEVEALSDDSITVDGQAYAITDETQILGTPEVGGNVLGMAYEGEDGSYTAIFIDATGDSGPPSQNNVSFQGEVAAISDDSITVGDQVYAIDENTDIIGNPVVGSLVHGWAQEEDNGDYTALFIEVSGNQPPIGVISFDGEVEAISDDSITVDGDVFAIDADTEISGDPIVGDFVFGLADEEDDGLYTAIFIEVLGDEPPQGNFPFWGEVDAISDTSLTVDDETFAIDADTEISGDPQVGDYVEGLAQIEDDGSLTALSVEVVDAPPPPSDVIPFDGTVEAISAASITVAGEVFAITNETQVIGDPQVGDMVFGVAQEEDDGSYTALFIQNMDNPNGGNSVDLMGRVMAFTTDTITVGDQVVNLTDDTEVLGEIELDVFVYVLAEVEDDDSLTAIYIEVMDDGDNPGHGFPVIGIVESYSDSSITVDDFVMAIDGDTEIVGEVTVDALVLVLATGTPAEGLTATYIEVLDNGTNGVCEGITNNSITVDGQVFNLTSQTSMVGNVAIGSEVTVGVLSNGRAGGQTALYVHGADAQFALFLPVLSK